MLDEVGVFEKIFPEVSLILRGMKGNVLGFSFIFFLKFGK